MKDFLLGIYSYFRARKAWMVTSLLVLTALFAAGLLRLHYSEDISDFLPLGQKEKEAMGVYRNISGADRLFVLFTNPDDADLTVEAIDRFTSAVQERDSEGWCADLTSQVDMGTIQDVASFVYANAPYFLNEADYRRMDSLLARPGYVKEQLARDMDMLLFPTGGVVASTVSGDPLGLFSPVMSSLQDSNPQLAFEMYDGYIFTPDMSRAVVMLTSPFGNSETEYNGRLVKLLQAAIDDMNGEYPQVQAHLVGGPEIAVGNASRIKKDSILAIALSAVLIILLLAYSFNSFRNILLILLSIGWGWLFAMAGMSVFVGSVSLIVIGISSVILGIAVNYPLHLIAHTGHQPDIKEAMKDIMAPLVVGNITTVGAFLALVPLQSVALRDLGLFASMLLVGTILFVLTYLPHFIKVKKVEGERHTRVLDAMAAFSPEKYPWMVAAVLVLTLVLGWFSLQTGFDSNIANMNYMTEGQRADMQYFQDLMAGAEAGNRTVYALSAGDSYDQALEAGCHTEEQIRLLMSDGLVQSNKGVSRFLSSARIQKERLQMWQDFVKRHSNRLAVELPREAAALGFSASAFAGFNSLVQNASELEPQPIEYFHTLTSLILSQNITTLEENGKVYIVNTLSVKPEDVEAVKARLDSSFDVASMNSSLSNNLSDNFNYIGWACSLIVFFFLWFSFGKVELAIISFLPMAVSWVWILGIMSLLGIQFNIVNVILATFIFGQGDDYTIFITEGCQYEYTWNRPILASYKKSIIQSALIMFAGIGTLIVAKHPAMHSLAEITIIGMFSVVLMSYMIPPFCFNLLTRKNGRLRQYPVTVKTLLTGAPSDDLSRVEARYTYKGKEICSEVRRNLKKAAALPLSSLEEGSIFVYDDAGYGELSILLALTNPNAVVKARFADSERMTVAMISAQDFVQNIEFELL